MDQAQVTKRGEGHIARYVMRPSPLFVGGNVSLPRHKHSCIQNPRRIPLFL